MPRDSGIRPRTAGHRPVGQSGAVGETGLGELLQAGLGEPQAPAHLCIDPTGNRQRQDLPPSGQINLCNLSSQRQHGGRQQCLSVEAIVNGSDAREIETVGWLIGDFDDDTDQLSPGERHRDTHSWQQRPIGGNEIVERALDGRWHGDPDDTVGVIRKTGKI